MEKELRRLHFRALFLQGLNAEAAALQCKANHMEQECVYFSPMAES